MKRLICSVLGAALLLGMAGCEKNIAPEWKAAPPADFRVYSQWIGLSQEEMDKRLEGVQLVENNYVEIEVQDPDTEKLVPKLNDKKERVYQREISYRNPQPSFTKNVVGTRIGFKEDNGPVSEVAVVIFQLGRFDYFKAYTTYLKELVMPVLRGKKFGISISPTLYMVGIDEPVHLENAEGVILKDEEAIDNFLEDQESQLLAEMELSQVDKYSWLVTALTEDGELFVIDFRATAEFGGYNMFCTIELSRPGFDGMSEDTKELLD